MAGDRWLEPNWQDNVDAGHYLSLLLKGNTRRQFGLLEEPAQELTGAGVIRYKILLWGKAGIGKTSTISKLCGLKVPAVHYETPGIRVTSTFWPAKLERQGKVVFFRFEFWDVGEKACAKFDHILTACKEKSDAVMFLFSFTDRASFKDLPNQMSQLLPKDSNVLRLVVGTRFDLFSRSDVTEAELRAFAQEFDIPVLRIRNVNNTRPLANGVQIADGRASLLEIAPLMNTVGEFLLQRDQRLAHPRSATTASAAPTATSSTASSSSSLSLPLVNMATALPRAPHQQAPRMDRGSHLSVGSMHSSGKRSASPGSAAAGGGAAAATAAGGGATAAAAAHNPIGPGRRAPASSAAYNRASASAGELGRPLRSDYTPPLQRAADTPGHHALTPGHHSVANITQHQPHTLSLSDMPRTKAGIQHSASDFSLGSIASSTPSTPGSSGEFLGVLSEPNSRSNSMPRPAARAAGNRPTTDV